MAKKPLIFAEIPVPTDDPKSLLEAVKAIKENLETLTGEKGPGGWANQTYVSRDAPIARLDGDRWYKPAVLAGEKPVESIWIKGAWQVIESGGGGGGGGTGPPGPQGNPGPPGAAGPAGPAGPQGATGGAIIYVNTIPPPSPVVDQLWYNTSNVVGGGQLYIYYDDGNTIQWVPAAAASNAQGAPGPAGPQGNPGAAGAQGPAGATGAQGPPGAASTVPGPQGPAGATGAQGPQGNPGATGAQGPQGTPGADSTVPGPQGPAGATGAQGPQGTPGAAGAQGIQGPAGATGAQGPVGGAIIHTGTTPQASPQNSELWWFSDNSPGGGQLYIYYFDGNTTQWVPAAAASNAQGAKGDQGIQGVQGPVGATGAQGPQGNVGATGAQGPQGNVGATGAQGPQGNTGLTGNTGAQGPQGNPGVDGNTVLYGTVDPVAGTGVNGNFYINTTSHVMFGPKAAGVWPAGTSLVGPQGAAGAAGATGSQGPQGIQGPVGNTGAQGPVGNTGATGSQGPQGTAGATGAQGPQGNPGVDGNTVLYGTANPTAGQGVNGNFFINTSTNFIFGPKAAGAWPAGTSLVGPQGAAGAAGSTGATGSQGPQGIPGVAATSSNVTATLGADVAMTPISTYINGPTTGSIGANGQVWLILATFAVYGSVAENPYVGLQVWNGASAPIGTTIIPVNNFNHTYMLHGIITLTAATTFTLRASALTGTAGSVKLSADGTRITAIRLA